MATPEIKIFELLLAFQQRRRFLRRHYPAGTISSARAHVLLQLDTESDSSASDLALHLGLDKSTISRELSEMSRDGLIFVEEDLADRRKKRLKITKKGYAALEELDQSQQEILLRCFEELTEVEVQTLTAFLHEVANAFGARPLRRRLRDHPATLELRRFFRGLGMLASVTTVGTLSISGIHIFLELKRHPGGLTSKEIIAAVPFEPSTLSRRLSAYEKESLIIRTADATDARSFRFSLSPEGHAALDAYMEQVHAPIRSALAEISATPEQIVESLRRVAARDHSSVVTLDSELEVDVYRSEEERHAARAFLVEELLRRNQHLRLPSELLPERNILMVLQQKKKLRGFCEFIPSADALELGFCLLPDEGVSPQTLRAALHELLEKATGLVQAKRITIPAESSVAALLGTELGEAQGSRRELKFS